MFIGRYANNMDDKGRVNIPAQMRDTLRTEFNDTRLIITLDTYDNCLRAYPLQEWNKLLEKLRQLPSTEPNVRAFTRRVVSSAFESIPDKQGRVLLAPTLREHAQLSKSVVFAGSNNTFEIWDDQLLKQMDSNLDPVALAGFGI